ncbi:hypothetical protein BpHYR1_011777, partial [Brachionus plicatilis]
IKQIKTQNRQKKVTFDTLKIDDENKFEPSYTGPFFIDRITEYGNYNLKNEKGERIEESYPRWRLKLAKQEMTKMNRKMKYLKLKKFLTTRKLEEVLVT